MKGFVKKIIRAFLRKIIGLIHDTPYLYGQHPIEIGNRVSLSNTILNSRSGKIEIGDLTIFGHNCMVLTGYHDVEVFDDFRPTITDAKRDILIGQNVWLGSGVIVVGPVKIGNNSVIGAGSVVTNDVPAGTFAAGVPAKVIKELKRRD